MGRLTLDEAIQHCLEKSDCSECGQEHAQLAEWLKELKQLRQKTFDVEAVVNVVREAGAKLCCNKSCNNNCDCCVVDDALRTIIDAIRKGGVK